MPGKNKETLIGLHTSPALKISIFGWDIPDGMSAVIIEDNEIKGLAWLSNSVRNELVHFVPKHYSICIMSIKRTCLIAIQVNSGACF